MKGLRPESLKHGDGVHYCFPPPCPHRSTANTVYMMDLGSFCMDWRDKQSRNHGTKYILKSISRRQNIRLYSRCKNQMQHLDDERKRTLIGRAADMMTFDLLNNQEDLVAALSVMSHPLSVRVRSKNVDLGHYFLLAAIWNNDLVLRYLSQHRKLWRVFLHAVLSVEFNSVTTNNYFVCDHFENVANIVRGSMCFWRVKQWNFVIDNGLMASFMRSCNITMRRKHMDMAGVLYWRAVSLLQRIERRTDCKLLPQLNRTLMEFGGYQFLRLLKSDSFHRGLVMSQTQTAIKDCGWPCCKHSGKAQTANYICKGCRLIRYCCRDHQKRHWKYIHSQQCKRY